MVQEILGKSDISSKETKENKTKHVWLSGRLHIEARLNEDEDEAKQNKRTPEKDVMASVFFYLVSTGWILHQLIM